MAAGEVWRFTRPGDRLHGHLVRVVEVGVAGGLVLVECGTIPAFWVTEEELEPRRNGARAVVSVAKETDVNPVLRRMAEAMSIVILALLLSISGVGAASGSAASSGNTASATAAAVAVPITKAQRAMWAGGLYNTWCYQGTSEVQLWTYQAPMWGAWVWFSSGRMAYFYGWDFGGGSWGVTGAYLDGSRPTFYRMDWKYTGVSGAVTVYCD